MALGFSSGLLTGLQTAGQGGSMPSDPRDQNLLQKAGVTNPLLQQFGQGFGGMFGVDTRSQNEQMQGALQAIDPTASDATSQMEAALSKYGDPKTAAVVLQSRIKREKDLAIRQALSAIDTSTVQGKRQYAAILARDPERAGEARQWMQEAQTQEQFVATKTAERGLAAQAREYGVSDSLIQQFEEGKLPKEAMQEEIKSARDVKIADNVAKMNSTSQINYQINRAVKEFGSLENIPSELKANIEDGMYVDSSKKEGNNKLFLDDLQGRNIKNETYVNRRGETFTLNSQWGRVYKDGKWSTPEELDLVKFTASSQTDSPSGITKMPIGQASMLPAAAGALTSLAKKLDGAGPLNVAGQILQAELNPFSTDDTEQFKTAANFTREAIGRALSGATIPEAENERLTKSFTITKWDIASPMTVAKKIRNGMIITNIASMREAGEINAAQARKMITEGIGRDFSKEEKTAIMSGQYDQVLSQYYPKGLVDATSTGAAASGSIISDVDAFLAGN